MHPIFILGVHRSGTTWIANALCNHSGIFGIQSPEHYGIVESWYFSHLDGRFGDLKHPDNFARLRGTFTRTAFFQASGLDPGSLESTSPSSYADFFDQFMHLATRERTGGLSGQYWLEKTPVHTLYVDKIIRYYPQVRFVGIERDLVKVAQSIIGLKADQGQEKGISLRSVLKIVFHWHKYHCHLEHFSRKYPSHFFRFQYEILLQDPGLHYKKCLDYLDLAWEDAVLDQRFPLNTSTRNKPDLLRARDYQNINMTDHLVGTLPYAFHRLHESLRNPRNREPIPFIIG